MSLTTINSDNVFKKGVIGNVRTAQEDSHDMAIMTPNGDVFVVCDGMGGHVGGAKASSIAVSSIIEYLKKEKYNDIPQALNEAIQYANMQIIGFASANPEFKGMGTTACIVVLQEKEAYIAHVGDSRIYLYLGKEQQLHRVTKDHSYVQTLVDKGEISDDDAEHHPNKNRILKALGIRPKMTPTVNVVHPKNGDIFLICTDGLNGMICDNTIEQAMKQDLPLEARGELLINLAMQGEPGYPGGQDNCTLELIKIDNSPWQKSEFISFNPKPKVKPSSKPNAGEQQPKTTVKADPGTSKKTPSFSLKKLAFILVPLVLILVCALTIPIIKENRNEEKLNEFNIWIEKQEILEELKSNKSANTKVDEQINRDFGSKEKFDMIYKESKKKEDYSNIKLYYENLYQGSKKSDSKTQLNSINTQETTENKTKEEDKSKVNKQEEPKEMPSPNSQDNTTTLYESFKRAENISFGIKSIELKVGKYEITFINRDKFYPQNICDLFNVKVDDFLEWNNYESANNVGGNGTELKIIKDEGYFWYKLHEVKKDDILNDISETYNVKIEDVQNCNGITNPDNIKPGQQLI